MDAAHKKTLTWGSSCDISLKMTAFSLENVSFDPIGDIPCCFRNSSSWVFYDTSESMNIVKELCSLTYEGYVPRDRRI